MSLQSQSPFLILVLLVVFFNSCQNNSTEKEPHSSPLNDSIEKQIKSSQERIYPWFSKMTESTTLVKQTPVPDGFKRMKSQSGSFADWLQHLPLKKEGTKVYYYNDDEKYTQEIHEAIIDIDIPNKDIQSSEDAIIRLRSEYLFSKKLFDKIKYQTTNNEIIAFSNFLKEEKPSYIKFKKFLEIAAKPISNTSLSDELEYILLGEMQIGDIFIQGGKPGHAAIILDMAINDGNQKVFLLAQSFIPTQDIHILKNLNQYDFFGAWFPMNFGTTLYTPEWEFSMNDLRRF